MVFCTYCGHSFTRDEHLERHILTHTNVKPFKCFTCHMSFARRDLLQRHYTVHGRDQNQQEIPAANGMIPKSAGRTPIACSNCAKTKTKCDKKFPCSRCAGRNLRCTLRPTRRSTKNASRMGLITPETLAAAGQIPPGETLAAEKVAAPTACNSPEHQRPIQIKPASPTQQGTMSPNNGNHSQIAQRHQSFSHEKPVDGPQSAATYERPSSGSTPSGQMLSPVTPGNGNFLSATPLSGFDDFAQGGKDSEESSPRFMLDWNQMQMPMGFDPMAGPDTLMASGLGLDMNGMALGPNGEPVFFNMGDLSTASLITPIETPKVEQAFNDLDISKRGMVHPHDRQMSVASANSFHSVQSMPSMQTLSSMPTNMSSVPDLGAVIAAQDGWNVFRCTPAIPSSSCPTTAKLNLERLEQTLKNHDGWTSWTPPWNDTDFAAEPLTVMQLHESTRDKLLAITQSFLHKALETHRGSGHSSIHGQSPMSTGSNFVILPPARVLEYFLRSYANNFERYYQLTSRGTLDANELMHCYNDKASSLLILMMIAQGAMNIPSTEARWLTGGLTEACRISLFDLVERNIAMASDPIVLHAALLFTEQAAWSGDKWQMDIAMGQRGMYSYMLRHSGLLDSAPHARNNGLDHQSSPDHVWADWIQQESRSRLTYSWAMVDQDLALFHDTAPLFSVTEFGAPMPDVDRLWHAKNATEWSSLFEQVHEFGSGFPSMGSGARPLSLRDLFRYFLDDEVLSQGIEMTPLQMRLLLHPLQSMVCHNSQLIGCFSDNVQTRSKNSGVTAASTRCRVEEVQCLLNRWYKLAEHYLKSQPFCPVMQANLVLFHLISLNAITNFPEIEKLARREAFDGTYQALVWIHKRCIADVNEATFHCGQVLRLVRGMAKTVRPPWWAGAVYRSALVLWCDSLINKDGPSAPSVQQAQQQFAIDALPSDHPAILRFLNKSEGVPCLSRRDGSTVPIDHGLTVLGHSIELIDEGASSRFSDGIRGKLDRLMRS